MGIDFETLIILAVLAFILFGPEKLPEFAATLGRFVAKLRQATSEMSRQYQNPFQYPQEPDPASGPRNPLAHTANRKWVRILLSAPNAATASKKITTRHRPSSLTRLRFLSRPAGPSHPNRLRRPNRLSRPSRPIPWSGYCGMTKLTAP